MIRNIIDYTLIGLLILLMFPVSILLFPLAYPFRNKAYNYSLKHGVIGWHPLQWCNWFFTKYKERGDWYTGPHWYMKELKDKTFHYWTTECKEDPIPLSPWQHIIYFLIAYRWCGFRNFMWNLRREITEEGGTWDGIQVEEVEIKKENITNVTHPDKLIFPQLKYVDENCNYRDNKGPLLLFPDNECGFPTKKCTILGSKFARFPTVRNRRKRFLYRKTKVTKYWAFEFYIGWTYQGGQHVLYFKNRFKKNERIK